MKSNEVIKAIHENAVAHGWWEEERGFGEIAALIHSELSEALEEYRNEKPFVYYAGFDAFGRKLEEAHPIKPYIVKPEGIAVELADTVIRVLDYFGKIGYTVEELSASNPETDDVDEAPYQNFGDFVANCHADVSAAYDDMNGERNLYLCDCCARIERWFRRNGLDLEEVIAIKNEYNKSRPYRHGGKKC